MWAVEKLALWLVFGAATFVSPSAVRQLQQDNFKAYLETHALVLVGCKSSLIIWRETSKFSLI